MLQACCKIRARFRPHPRRRWTWILGFSLLLLNLYHQWFVTLTTIQWESSKHHQAGSELPLASSIPTNASTLTDNVDDSTWTDARFPNGSLGYIADPYALKRSRHRFLEHAKEQENDKDHDTVDSSLDDYWRVLQHFASEARQNTSTGNMSLSWEHVCAPGPGRGLEEEGGYKLLTEKIRVASVGERKMNTTSTTAPPRILCALYTHPPMHDLARTAALSWGYKCDGFLAFSTQTVHDLGLVHLVHAGPESYHNMWQKVRSLWTYVYEHYRNDFDYFHLGGDDMYVIVENLRRFLSGFDNNTEPLFLGQWIRQKNGYYVSGGPGYTFNRVALKQLVNVLPVCHVDTRVSYEDRLVSQCFKQHLGITGGDTRDAATGEQQYHDVSPHSLFTARAASGRRANFHSRALAYWEGLPHPAISNQTVGPKYGLEAAATYSVSLHNLYHPLYMARVHAVLYHTCPAESLLGRGLAHHLGLSRE